MSKLKGIALSILATVAFSCQRQDKAPAPVLDKFDLTEQGIVNGIDLHGAKDAINQRDANGKIILDTILVAPDVEKELPHGTTFNFPENGKPHLLYISHGNKGPKTP